jgi:hypothetical protein
MSWRIGYLQEYLKTNVKNTILPALKSRNPETYSNRIEGIVSSN